MHQAHHAHNRAAISSVIVGAVAFGLSLVGFIPGSPVFYYSVGGIFAVIGGIRALLQRRRGFGRVLWAPILAIVLGSLAVLLMGIGIVDRSTVNLSTGYTGSTTTTQNQSGASPIQIAAPPSFGTDALLTQYEQVAARISGGVLNQYAGGATRLASGQAWPSALTLSPNNTVLEPDGTAIGSVDPGEVLQYSVTSDGRGFDLFVSGGDKSEVAVYDSMTNSYTWTCPASDTTCPAGGTDPNSSST